MTGTSDPGERLTPQERRIAQQVSLGLTDKEIAAELFLRLETVQRYVAAIMRKLAAENREQIRQRFEDR